MPRPKLIVKKLNGGLGRRSPNADMVTGVVMNALATSQMELNKIYELRSVEDVEALGLSAEYDDTNNVLVYHRLKRLFLRNPSIIVFFMPVAQEVTLTQMADKSENYLAKLLRQQSGAIVQCIIARNPDNDYEATILNGLDKDSLDAIYKAQALMDAEFEKDRYAEVFVEGRNFTGTATGVANLRGLLQKCPDVSVVIGADYKISSKKEAYKYYAAVEDFAGMVSKAAVSQNAGELIEAFNLTDVNEDAFIVAGLSSGLPISDYNDTDLDTLNDKGYIYAVPVSGMAGFWFNDTPTCTVIADDYAYVENNRTIKKAIKLARLALLPRVKGRLYVDDQTGFMKPEVIKELETIAKTALNPMLQDGDISGGVDAYINPEQNILATSEFEVLLTFVPVAIGRKITLKVGFKNPLKN
ncbi:DUF2586 family protein [Riemerella anatipestifer]|nr:DUF2586 family protein [Riemerella anatipestifer]